VLLYQLQVEMEYSQTLDTPLGPQSEETQREKIIRYLMNSHKEAMIFLCTLWL